MKSKSYLIVFFLLIFNTAFSTNIVNIDKNRTKLEADEIIIYKNKDEIKLNGNVVVNSGDVNLYADKMIVYFQEKKGKNDITKIIGSGNILLKNENINANSDDFSYEPSKNTITMYNNIEPVICFTKLDLLNLEELKEINSIINYYESIGYVTVKNTQIDKIKYILKNNLSVFVGQSGAGKSSLLNKLDSKLELKTNEISKALGRGKHTTRHVELFEVCEGLVVDTPGFSSLDLSSLSNMDIRDNMKEMFDNLDKCKYRDCMHYKEDGCYVKSLVDDNVILKSRYDNYISFLRK